MGKREAKPFKQYRVLCVRPFAIKTPFHHFNAPCHARSYTRFTLGKIFNRSENTHIFRSVWWKRAAAAVAPSANSHSMPLNNLNVFPLCCVSFFFCVSFSLHYFFGVAVDVGGVCIVCLSIVGVLLEHCCCFCWRCCCWCAVFSFHRRGIDTSCARFAIFAGSDIAIHTQHTVKW